MKSNFNIFYSWQSDIKKNRYLIEDCIKKAVSRIQKSKEQTVSLDIKIDRDIKDTQGSPEIANTIFKKIDNSDIFICDVTLINKSDNSELRLTPNPNVLIELGYAIHKLGWKRIICINNLKYGNIEDLPFDIRHHRILSYNPEHENYKNNLTGIIKTGISSIIENYDDIIKNFNKNNFKEHDKHIFQQIEKILSEEQFN